MKHEATGDQEAGHAALGHPEGKLSGRSDRPPAGGRSLPSLRLKRSVEVYRSGDGTLHLIQEGLGRHFRVDDPEPADLATLEILRAGIPGPEVLRRELRARDLDPARGEESLQALAEIGLIEHRDRRSGELGPNRAERYDRQLIYLADIAGPESSGEALQGRLLASTVTILGCGGLGSWAACGLACAGVGNLRLIDDDTVELSNLNRQLLFGEPDLGRPKVEAAARSLRRNDHLLEVECHRHRVGSSAEIADLIQGSDLLICTADWPPHELPRWVNRASLETGVPYISAGQLPPVIRVGPMVIPGRSACLECQEAAISEEYPLYEELASHRAGQETTASTLGAASGMIGSIISMEAIHLLTGTVDPASIDRALIMDLRTMSMDHEPVARRSDCACSAVPEPA